MLIFALHWPVKLTELRYQLLLNPELQRDAAVGGFESIPFLLRLYRMIDRLQRPGQRSLAGYENEDNLALVKDSEKKIVQQYDKVYECQIRLMCQYSHVWVDHFGRDIIKADDWAKMLGEIQTLDSNCSRLSNELGQEELEGSISENNCKIDGLVQSWFFKCASLT